MLFVSASTSQWLKNVIKYVVMQLIEVPYVFHPAVIEFNWNRQATKGCICPSASKTDCRLLISEFCNSVLDLSIEINSLCVSRGRLVDFIIRTCSSPSL